MARPARRPGARPGPARAARKPPGRLWRYRRLWFLLAIVGLTALAGAFWVVTQVPLPSAVPQAETTMVFDAAGGQLASIHGSENRIVVSLDAVPKVVQDAVVAAEDRNFFTHKGVDPIGILRATLVDVRRGGATQGGSTITQQYVKNVYVGNEPTLWRKIREAMIAIKLERTRTKPEILERYLNTVYFGRGAYGIQAASRAYFDKDVSQLGLREAAYLAGIIRSPSSSDVTTDPARASDLRAVVLDAMVRDSVISPAQSAEVKAMALREYVTAKAPSGSTVSLPGAGAEYFVEYVRQELVRRYHYSEERVLRGGLQVHTSLDPVLQRAAYASIYDPRTGLLNGRNDPAGALVSLDTAGRVVAMVGGRDWGASKVNLAVGTEGGGAGRQGGSTFKPFVLAAAVRDGIPLSTTFEGPAEIVIPKADRGADWPVSNYDDAGFGRVDLVEATANSVNTVYAQLVMRVGPARVVDMAHRLGIRSPLEAVPSIALGTQNVSVMEMAGAYRTFTDGQPMVPRVITKVVENGSVQLDDRPELGQALSPKEADAVKAVKGALRQVVQRGSGVRARLRTTPVWGKTGTSDGFTDAWFVGFTDRYTTAVWMGYPQNEAQMANLHGFAKVNGGSLPAMIFQRFMTRATPGDANGPPLPPVPIPSATPSTTVASDSSPVGKPDSGKLSDEKRQGDKEATTETVPSTAPSTPVQGKQDEGSGSNQGGNDSAKKKD